MFEPGDRVGIANPGYPPYRHILKALGCEPVLIETGDATRWAVTPEAVLAAHRNAQAGRAPGRKPRQSDRHHDAAGGARGADPCDRGGGHPLHLRRNLSWPRLCVPGRDRLADLGPVAGDQFLLEIFLHDRLAHRLDRRARAAGSSDRAAAGQSRDQRADAVADRGGSGLRRPRRDGCGQARLRGQPPHPDRGPAEGRAGHVSFRSTARSISMPMSARFSDDSHDFAKRMLDEAHVAATPGVDFDPVDGRHYMRFCYAQSQADMREAVGGSGNGCASDERCRPDPRRCRARSRRCSVLSRAMSTASPFSRCSDFSPRR